MPVTPTISHADITENTVIFKVDSFIKVPVAFSARKTRLNNPLLTRKSIGIAFGGVRPEARQLHTIA